MAIPVVILTCFKVWFDIPVAILSCFKVRFDIPVVIGYLTYGLIYQWLYFRVLKHDLIYR
jgi:hypothetical protein